MNRSGIYASRRLLPIIFKRSRRSLSTLKNATSVRAMLILRLVFIFFLFFDKFIWFK